jgi:HEAT repeat protein
MRRFLLATLFALVALPARAEVTVQQMAQALAGYENPVTEARLKALGPGWEAAAEALLRDPATRPILRPRAIYALGFARTPTVATTLREVLASRGAATEGPAVIETREAVRSLFAVEGAKALPELKKYLEHPVLDVRLVAVESLQSAGGAQAKAALRGRQGRESEPVVRDAISAALKRLGD